MMDQTRFQALADAYGGDMDRWPLDERAAGRAFAEAFAGAAKPILDEAAVLDGLLRDAGASSAPSALFSAVLAGAPSGSVSGQPSPAPRWAAMAAALMLTAGVGAGWIVTPDGSDAAADALFAEAFATLETDTAFSTGGEEDAR
jgi:hypothetical protein